MNAPQRIVRERRQYNKWVATDTLEDYALRYTPRSARRWTAGQVASTAIGASSFLACEAIGAAITLAYGFSNSIAAIGAAIVLMFLIGLPIAHAAARHGLDIDLLTRGAGFGYLGSTITSLIYASFTFLLFAIEASIMSVALSLMLGIPLWLSHIVSALAVIPIAFYGMRAITRMQRATQPVWLLLQLAPIVYILLFGREALGAWSNYQGIAGAAGGGIDLLLFGLALSTLLSLLPQIGEQADYLRFLPSADRAGHGKWWVAMLAGGPGWALIAGAKLLLGSLLAVYALGRGLDPAAATSPTDVFLTVFRDMVPSPAVALALTGVLVITCQMKINVTNAYAGSIAWSNFFSRLTHAHPGRVVWLVFNVALALLLMEVGILRAIEAVLLLYANLAAGWIGALAADLVISKPLGLSPAGIEFKRARLYDVNPVGVGAMALSITVSMLALTGVLGTIAQAFAPLVGLIIAFVAAPAFASATRGRFYLARDDGLGDVAATLRCTICENRFERPDMAHCPAYAAPICSLCCTLESRCHDLCKDRSGFADQATDLLGFVLPDRLARSARTMIGHFLALMLLFSVATAVLLATIHAQYSAIEPAAQPIILTTLTIVFLTLLIIYGIAAWLMVLAHDSRRAAEADTAHHTAMLVAEIAAHRQTDTELQKAKEVAEAANAAKSRYLVGVSHEIRSPLNSIYGYAQLLERDSSISPHEAARVIRRSSEHLTNLVEGLLDIARIESGVLRLSRDTVRLPALLDQVADMFRYQAAAKGLDYRYDRPDWLPEFVRTDQKRLRQVLINLLSNAVKYTPAGFIGFTMRYRSQVAEFEVADSGIGIRPEDLDAIFDPFERGGMSDAHAQHGVGLGLAITRVLVQIMGGEITVRSTPGEGSRFVVRLMLPEPIRPPAESLRLRRIIGYEGARRTILIIDDDAAQLTVLRVLLEPIGFVVHSALEGTAGLALAAQCSPDLVILDIAMPGLSGWEVALRLRADRPDLRIAMVSANAHEYSPGGDGRAAHDLFLMKPVDLDTLLDRLAEQLGLDWITVDGDMAEDASHAATDIGDPPSSARPFLAELERLGRIGHVRGIEAKLAEMGEVAPDTAGFASVLRARVKTFDLKSFVALVTSGPRR